MTTFVGQSQNATKASGSVSVTYAANVAVGDMIIVLAGANGTLSSVSDGANTFEVSTGTVATMDLGYAWSIATSTRTTANSVSITTNGTKVVGHVYIIRATAGESLSVVFPSTGTSGTTTTNTRSYTSPSNTIVYGAIVLEGPTGDTFTGDTDTTNGSWSTNLKGGTSGAGATTNITMSSQYKDVTASGSQTYNTTMGTARTWSNIIIGVHTDGVTADGTSTSTGSADQFLSATIDEITADYQSDSTGSLDARTSILPLFPGDGATSTGSADQYLRIGIVPTGQSNSTGSASIVSNIYPIVSGQSTSTGEFFPSRRIDVVLSGSSTSTGSLVVGLNNSLQTISGTSTSTVTGNLVVGQNMGIVLNEVSTSSGSLDADTTSTPFIYSTQFGAVAKASSVQATPPATINVGDYIVIGIFDDGTTTPTISDGGLNTYTLVNNVAGAASPSKMSYAYTKVTSEISTATNITVTGGATVSKTGFMAYVFSTSPYYGVSVTLGSAVQSQTTTGTSMSVTQSGATSSSVIVGFAGVEANTSDGWTPTGTATAGTFSTDYKIGTTGGAAGTNLTMHSQYKIPTANQSQTYSATLGTARTFAAAMPHLLGTIALVASAEATSTSSGDLHESIYYSVTADGTSTTTGSLATGIVRYWPTTASGTSNTTGALAADRVMLVSASGTSASTGSGAIGRRNAMTGSGQSNTTGSFFPSLDQKAVASGTSNSTGSGSMFNSMLLTGMAASLSSGGQLLIPFALYIYPTGTSNSGGSALQTLTHRPLLSGQALSTGSGAIIATLSPAMAGTALSAGSASGTFDYNTFIGWGSPI